jgi:hypothetical protein
MVVVPFRGSTDMPRIRLPGWALLLALPFAMPVAAAPSSPGLSAQEQRIDAAVAAGQDDAIALLAEAIDGENFIHGELRRRNFSGLRLGD